MKYTVIFDGDFDGQKIIGQAVGAARAVAYFEGDLHIENERLREVLAWYGEQARLARLIHREGDPGRHALSADGGARARAALAEQGEK